MFLNKKSAKLIKNKAVKWEFKKAQQDLTFFR